MSTYRILFFAGIDGVAMIMIAATMARMLCRLVFEEGCFNRKLPKEKKVQEKKSVLHYRECRKQFIAAFKTLDKEKMEAANIELIAIERKAGIDNPVNIIERAMQIGGVKDFGISSRMTENGNAIDYEMRRRENRINLSSQK